MSPGAPYAADNHSDSSQAPDDPYAAYVANTGQMPNQSYGKLYGACSPDNQTELNQLPDQHGASELAG